MEDQLEVRFSQLGLLPISEVGGGCEMPLNSNVGLLIIVSILSIRAEITILLNFPMICICQSIGSSRCQITGAAGGEKQKQQTMFMLHSD